jgi:hypothetical protein
MDKDILRALKSFEKEECHKMWNNKKCKLIGRKKGCSAWNKGRKK